MIVGWLEQAKTLVTPADRNNFNTIGFVPRTTFLLELRLPERGRREEEGKVRVREGGGGGRRDEGEVGEGK